MRRYDDDPVLVASHYGSSKTSTTGGTSVAYTFTPLVHLPVNDGGPWHSFVYPFTPTIFIILIHGIFSFTTVHEFHNFTIKPFLTSSSLVHTYF